jgi:hypothetical protein
MNKYAIPLLLPLLLATGCDQESRGFNLPPGDAEQGRATYMLLQCNDCHSIRDVVPHSGADSGIDVVLGGQTTRVRTYGDLVTSIIHPSHRLSRGTDPATVTEEGESKMRNYNDVMSVQELIDLVEFLQGQYEIWVPDYYSYRR